MIIERAKSASKWDLDLIVATFNVTTKTIIGRGIFYNLPLCSSDVIGKQSSVTPKKEFWKLQNQYDFFLCKRRVRIALFSRYSPYYWFPSNKVEHHFNLGTKDNESIREGWLYQIGWIFGGGGHFQSKNLCCRFPNRTLSYFGSD